jgi:hypothetical protein
VRLVVLIIALLLPVSAQAAPVVYWAVYFATTYVTLSGAVTVLALVNAVYGGWQARLAAERAKKQARIDYNNSLNDRTVTGVASNAAHRTIYGRTRVGSDIVAMFASGARDEYKHIVCVHAAHECDAIEEVYINSVALGTLDANGDVTSGDYLYQRTLSINSEEHSGTSFTLAHTPIPGSVRITYINSQDKRKTMPFTLSGANITVATSHSFDCHYDYIDAVPRVRVTKHLGTPTDTADAGLMALGVGWTDAAVLRDFCYTVIRLDLNQEEFKGGIPPIEVLVRGKKLYDPRSGLTAWSQNPTLAVYDYLTGEMCGVDASDLPLADYITAANVCDEAISIGARYTINGTVTSDQDQAQILTAMAECMAGTIVATTWSLSAGKYTAPVMAFDQSDIVGALSIAAGTPDANLYNGVKGRYVGVETQYVPTDFTPYQNSTYVTSDGRELWTNIDFNFTDELQRVHNLARILCEDQRNGFTVKASFSLKAWRAKIGQRVTLTSTFLGQAAKVYRVTDKRFGIDQAVEITLKEDAASIWDLADTVTVDDTPNTNLPNPFSVGLCGDVQMVETIYETTGSAGVRSRARLSWTAPADVAVVDYELEYKPYTDGVWIELVNVRGTFYDFVDLAPDMYDFRVKARNSLGVVGEYTAIRTFTVYGLTAAPENISNFSVIAMGGVALADWSVTTSLDVKIGGYIEIRHSSLITGATWASGRIVRKQSGDTVHAMLPLITGTYMAKFIDSTGHYSATEAVFVATEALVTGWTTVATSTQHTAFAGTRTNCSAPDGVLKIDGASTIDSITGTVDTWGMVDSLGGVQASAEYEFDSVMDMTTVAVRRLHAHIKSLAYDTGDTIDNRLDSIDTWASIDGGAINDCNVAALISTTNDDPAGTPTWSAWAPFDVVDYSCRAARFKLQMVSGDTTHNIAISELSVTSKLPA